MICLLPVIGSLATWLTVSKLDKPGDAGKSVFPISNDIIPNICNIIPPKDMKELNPSNQMQMIQVSVTVCVSGINRPIWNLHGI